MASSNFSSTCAIQRHHIKKVEIRRFPLPFPLPHSVAPQADEYEKLGSYAMIGLPSVYETRYGELLPKVNTSHSYYCCTGQAPFNTSILLYSVSLPQLPTPMNQLFFRAIALRYIVYTIVYSRKARFPVLRFKLTLAGGRILPLGD